MAGKKNTEIANVASDEALADISNEFPRDPGFAAAMLPRLGMYSQDKTEKVGKTIKLVQEAGIFYTENATDATDEDGKKIWEKNELGTDIEGIILFQRKQLSFYDGVTFTSSPIYDKDDEVIPLWKDRAEIDRGTPAELQAREEYAGINARTGKPQSKLEENRILYVLFKGEDDEYKMYQMTVRGSSKWSFLTYVKKVSPNTVVTRMSSTPEKNGAIEWNKMSFEQVRKVTEEELAEVRHHTTEIKDGIAMVRAHFANMANVSKDPLADEFKEDDLPVLGDGKK